MTTITTRSGKGSPLTNDEVDANFTNLNDDKIEASGDSMTGNLSFGDNDKAIFGAGSDLQIYHDAVSNNSYIKESGSGALWIQGANVQLANEDASKQYAVGIDGGAFSINHNGVTKLSTTSTGIDVTGTVSADALTVTGTLGNWSIDTQGAIQTFTRPSANYIRASDASGSLRFDTGGSLARMNIANNGDVSLYEDTGTTAKFFWDASAESLGIGTSSPASPLHLFNSSTASSSLSEGLTLSSNAGSTNNRLPAITWDYGTAGTPTFAAVDASRASGTGGNLLFHTATTAGTLTEAMRIDSSGNVGIGTSSPASPLAVMAASVSTVPAAGAASSHFAVGKNDQYGTMIGTLGSGNGYIQQQRFDGTATTYNLAIQPNGGNVGIGTASPANTQGGLDAAGAILARGGVAANQTSAGGFDMSGNALRIRAWGATAGSGVIDFRTGGGGGSVDSQAMRIDSSGNVGIGTDSATQKLTVLAPDNNGIQIESGADEKGYLFFGDDASNTVGRIGYDHATDHLDFWTGSSEAMRIDSSGNVGIGTSSPSEALDVKKASDSQQITFGRTTSSAGSGIIGADVSQALGVWSGAGTKLLTVQQGGYVGIGTSSPSSTLEIAKNDKTNGATLSITNTYNSSDYNAGDVVGTINFRTDDVSTTQPIRGQIKLFEDSASGTTYANSNAMSFSTGLNNTLNERMRIDSAGRVGLGTSSPATTLTVEGSGANGIELNRNGADATQSARLFFDSSTSGYAVTNVAGALAFNSGATAGVSSGTERLRIDSSGNLGLGNSNPQNKLDIEQSAAVSARLLATGATSSSLKLEVKGGATQLTTTEILANSSGAMTFATGTTSSTERMRIDSSGRVGVGTSSPVSFGTNNLGLTVNGSAGSHIAWQNNGTNVAFAYNAGDNFLIGSEQAGSSTIFTSAGTQRMRIDSSGNVGIGTSTGLANGTLNVESNGTSVLQARSDTAGVNDGDTTVVVSRAVNSTAGKWANAIYRGYSHAWSYGNNAATTEAMRIDSSGNLLVGKSSADDFSSAGAQIEAGGQITNSVASAPSLRLNRGGTDGDIIEFNKAGTAVGAISTYGLGLVIGNANSSTYANIRFTNDEVFPCTTTGGINDDAIDLGKGNSRYRDIYAGNGTINTSDRNEKQDIEELSDAEQRVAVACKGLLRKFRWINSVADKGDDARIHFGIIAQDLQDAFAAEGLDAGRYGMFINSTWTDEETGEERSRMGVRYSELLAFIIAAI